jgi:hypothetical protein
MYSFVKKAAASKGAAPQSVKNHFVERLAEEKGGKKKKKPHRGKVMPLEMRAGYDWIEFMRKRIFPPTRLEFRCKVIVRVRKCSRA